MTAVPVEGVRRHFITVGRRQIHYRRAGRAERGPVLVLLHRLPRSSQDTESFLARWRTSFTMVAPDQAGQFRQ